MNFIIQGLIQLFFLSLCLPELKAIFSWALRKDLKFSSGHLPTSKLRPRDKLPGLSSGTW